MLFVFKNIADNAQLPHSETLSMKMFPRAGNSRRPALVPQSPTRILLFQNPDSSVYLFIAVDIKWMERQWGDGGHAAFYKAEDTRLCNFPSADTHVVH